MMKLLLKMSSGYQNIIPDKKIIWTKNILDLVDDARQYVNDWGIDQMSVIFSKLTQASQMWEQQLLNFGVKLEIPKYDVYAIR